MVNIEDVSTSSATSVSSEVPAFIAPICLSTLSPVDPVNMLSVGTSLFIIGGIIFGSLIASSASEDFNTAASVGMVVFSVLCFAMTVKGAKGLICAQRQNEEVV